MKKRPDIIDRVSVSSGLVLILAFVVWWSVAAQASDKQHGSHPPVHMNQIKTRAEAQALRPGDSIAMVCNMCKNIAAYEVARDNTHVMLLTIGHTHTCADCKGIVKVVGTGKGEGENEEVEHVCTKCGGDAMFVCATKPGMGSRSGSHE